MANADIRLDRVGIAAVLKTAFAPMVNAAAHEIASQIGSEAIVDGYTTDRNAAAVLVPAEQQATDGVLTRAAAAAGLPVRQKP
ncbi:hypothetical protein [Nocardia acidivorans]|uniref:hypothetical protein n=1 Tax=Nocardia acidivorans TaxID=404580 RepID=UPI00082D0DE6|nr:hypothetical protein [Nocardia acidivorans]